MTPRPTLADTPASQVITTQPADRHLAPTIAAGRQWVDIYGFCKTIDGPASRAPLPLGSAAEWQAFRHNAPASLQQTTCCRPQANVGVLCAGATNASPISRQYGWLGETDQVTGSCTVVVDGHTFTYVDTVSVTCSGDNGPDGQASWSVAGDSGNCASNAFASAGACSASCGGGSQTVTVYNSCGHPQSSYSQSCNTQSCCTPNWQTSCGSCNQSTGRKGCTTYDANNCAGSSSSSESQSCTYGQIGAASCSPYNACDGSNPVYCNYIHNSILGVCGDYAFPQTRPVTWDGKGDASGAGNSNNPLCIVGTAVRDPTPPNAAGTTSYSCMGYY